jgi:hypothetical protein
VRTNGKGLYSTRATTVRLIKLELYALASHGSSLFVYFHPDDWRVEMDLHKGKLRPSLIYTDNLFQRETRKALVKLGLTADFGYSERGRQTADYVDFDTDPAFDKEWKRLVDRLRVMKLA